MTALRVKYNVLLVSAHFQSYNRKRSSFLNSFRAPPGARTLDPNIKSVVLYQLS